MVLWSFFRSNFFSVSEIVQTILRERGKHARVTQLCIAVALSSVNIVNGFRFYFSTSITGQRVSSIVTVQATSFPHIRFKRRTSNYLVSPGFPIGT